MRSSQTKALKADSALLLLRDEDEGNQKTAAESKCAQCTGDTGSATHGEGAQVLADVNNALFDALQRRVVDADPSYVAHHLALGVASFEARTAFAELPRRGLWRSRRGRRSGTHGCRLRRELRSEVWRVKRLHGDLGDARVRGSLFDGSVRGLRLWRTLRDAPRNDGTQR